MKTALIGYTGFVGSNLSNQFNFDDMYNSKNIQEISGKTYDLVVCAGARAEKWRINQEPEKDLNEIQDLINNLRSAKIDKLLLVSTVDVYSETSDVDENTNIESNSNHHAYGKNRRYLELECQKIFNTQIVRLPGLFGRGLKKNIIFDFLNNNNIDNIHSESILQYYNLDYIWEDIQKVLATNIDVFNFATEPIKTSELARVCFNREFNNVIEGVNPANYDIQTIHGDVFKSSTAYLYSKDQILSMIKDFVEKYPRKAEA